MSQPDSAASQFLLNAQEAMRTGDRQAARHWAELALARDRQLEEAWLILAAFASPRASVAYLEEALKINPASPRARKGMQWARERLLREGGPRRQPAAATAPEPAVSDTQPRRAVRPPAERDLGSAAPVEEPSAWSLTKYRRSFFTLVLLVAVLALAWLILPGNASPAAAFIRDSLIPQTTATEPGAPALVDKPTYTPTITPTFTPTQTFTPTSTFTATPLPTDTPLPTNTPRPTPTPMPTNTILPPTSGDPFGQFTGQTGEGERWIDVDLTQQRLYAYEGDTVVASFLVSTGVWQFPTVTGRFHIYVKYLYTDMAGVGYYLPNVPYTMYFYKGYGIHGTYWHNNFGHPMSHGCVNMYTPDAAWMFNFASVGTLVNVHY